MNISIYKQNTQQTKQMLFGTKHDQHDNE